MKVSYNWLQNYVSCQLDPKELADKLTMVGIAAEEVEYLGANLDKVVTGKIMSKIKHPNADRLSICKVDIGEEEYLNIVTGATNIEVGDIVPVATNGAILPNGVKIKKSKLRGEPSEGMMCSAQELCLDLKGLPPEQQNGILILPPDTPIGQDVRKVLDLDDTVITFELTANRGDCLSMVGIAREVAALTGNSLKMPQPRLEESSEKTEELIDIQIDASDLCKRYVAKIIKGVKVGPSPFWLQRALAKIGVRSINNVVDVTNYVMFELGQPLHAFDYDKLSGKRIVVRRARQNEEIVTLDGNKRILTEDNLVIADNDKPVGIAGVMGGENSEVTENTVNILIESANFDPVSIRRTAKQFNLRSEASLRFEKGVDPNVCELAAQRAAELIIQLAGGSVCQDSVNVYPNEVQPRVINLSLSKVNNLLGTNLTIDLVKEILEKLDLHVEVKDGELAVTVPTFRPDLVEAVDLIEEIARIYGYNQIEESSIKGEVTQGRKNRSQLVTDIAKDVLTACGLNEVITFSLVKPEDLDLINLSEDDERREFISLQNPLTEEQSILRTTLMPSILEVVARNLNRQVNQLGIFEIASVYYPKQFSPDQLALEVPQLVGAITGYPSFSGDNIVVEDGGFFKLKGIIENLFDRLAIKRQYIAAEAAGFHPGRTAAIVSGELILGVIGEVHPSVLENYKIAKRVCVFELNFANIIAKAKLDRFYNSLPKFPSISRDLAVVVKESVSSADLMAVLTHVGGELLEEVKLFDLYRGKNIPEGAKSLAYSLVYRVKDRTLTDEEVNEVHNRIVESLKEKFGAELRQ
ncbi:MAG TPA: phenylalanine--tRNA ligase subunit beta [Clostridia bacterium]|nr:phenylalanine--tRNA ligase subunit beta [Clostridia bacterium]